MAVLKGNQPSSSQGSRTKTKSPQCNQPARKRQWRAVGCRVSRFVRRRLLHICRLCFSMRGQSLRYSPKSLPTRERLLPSPRPSSSEAFHDFRKIIATPRPRANMVMQLPTTTIGMQGMQVPCRQANLACNWALLLEPSTFYVPQVCRQAHVWWSHICFSEA